MAASGIKEGVPGKEPAKSSTDPAAPLSAATLSPLKQVFEFIGEMWLLLFDAVRRLPTAPFEWRETVNQMAFIGVASVPIVVLTSCFSGAVLSLYLSEFLNRYGATTFVGATVGLTATRELGPVIAGITVAARCGSAMAAQIGSMAVTEQLDALKMLSVHPTKFLVIPRLIAGVTMLPILGLASVYSASVGGYYVAQTRGVAGGVFIDSYRHYTGVGDLTNGINKMPIFGLIITLVACQQGLRTKDGAVGVGRATTNTVVISIILVYVADFLMALIQY